MYDLVARFSREFPPDTAYRTVPVDSPDVRVLATDKVILVVNTLDRTISTKVDGQEVVLQAYQVKWLTR